MTTLEEALAKISELEGELSSLKQANASLLGKRDELLGEVKSLKGKYRDALGEIDPTEAAQIYQRYQKGELAPKDSLESELKGEWEKQSAAQLKELQTQIKQIREEKEAEKAARIKATIHGTFTSLLAPQLNAKPKHLLTILEAENRIKLSEAGEPVGFYKGEDLPPEQFVERLREDPDYQSYFRPSGKQGSGQNFGDGTKKTANPWVKESWNITKQMTLLKSNPTEAARLKSEAGVK